MYKYINMLFFEIKILIFVDFLEIENADICDVKDFRCQKSKEKFSIAKGLEMANTQERNI